VIANRLFMRALFIATFALLARGGLYEIEAEDLESGLPVPLSYYRGRVMLVVNVASRCGYTDSTYGQLNELHSRYATRGLSILAFPCNSFGGQEPGSDDEIFSFATSEKKAKFDFFRKVEVNGPSAHPLFRLLLGGSGDCADDESSCEAWATQGECETNPEFMHASCRRSCKLCSSPVSAANPIRWNFESFLISRTGQQDGRFLTGTDLLKKPVTDQIEALLDARDEL